MKSKEEPTILSQQPEESQKQSVDGEARKTRMLEMSAARTETFNRELKRTDTQSPKSQVATRKAT